MDNIQQLAEVLNGTLSPLTVHMSTKSISEAMQNQRMELIQGLIYLFINEEYSSITHIILIYLNRALSYDKVSFPLIKTLLEQDNGTFFQNLFTAAQALIMSDVESIRNNISQLLAYLYAFSIDISPNPIIEFCQSIIQNIDFPISAQVAALNVFDYLLFFPNFNSEIKKKESFNQVASYFFKMMVDAINAPVDESLLVLKLAAVSDLSDMLENYDDFYNLETIDLILSALPNSLQFPSPELFSKLNSLMYTMTTKFYVHAIDFFPKIHEYLTISLAMTDHEYLISALRFLIDIADFEFDIQYSKLIYSAKYKTTPDVQGICQKSSGDVLPLLLNFMKSYDPNNTQCQDDGEANLPAVAGMAMIKFARAAPSTTIPFILSNIPILLEEDSWVSKHVFVMLIYALMNFKLVGHPKANKIYDINSAYNFICEHLDLLFELSAQSDFEQLQDTSLWCLYKALQFISKKIVNTPGKTAEMFERCMSLLVIQNDTHPLIIKRLCSLIISLSQLTTLNSFGNPINIEFLDYVISFIDSIQKSNQVCHNVYLFEESAQAFSVFILKVPIEVAKEKLAEIFNMYYQQLFQILSNTEASVIYPLENVDKNIVISNLMSMMSHILMHPIGFSTNDLIADIIPFLIETLSNDPSIYFYDESIFLIQNIIKKSTLDKSEIIELITSQEFMQMIFCGIESQYEYSVKACCSILSTICALFKDLLEEEFIIPLIDHLIQIFQTEDIELETNSESGEAITIQTEANKQIRIYILQAFGDILNKLFRCFFKNSEKITKFLEYFQIYFESLNTVVKWAQDFEQSKEYAVAADELLRTVAFCVTKYESMFYKLKTETSDLDVNQIELELHNLIKPFVARINKLSNPSDASIGMFLNMLQKMVSVSSRRYNAKANNRFIRILAETIKSNTKYYDGGRILINSLDQL